MAAAAIRAAPVRPVHASSAATAAPPERTSLRVVVVLVGLIGLLAAMGVAGSLYLLEPKGAQARNGLRGASAPPAYAALPAMDFTLSDGSRLRMLRLKVLLEMDRVVGDKAVEVHGPRIASALSARMVNVTTQELNGWDGSSRVKDAVTVEANREMRPARVRRVLLQEMLIQ